MLKNKKILIIILAFISLLFLNINSYASTYEYSYNDFKEHIPEELKEYTYFLGGFATSSDGDYYYYHFSNEPFLSNDNGYIFNTINYHSANVFLNGPYSGNISISKDIPFSYDFHGRTYYVF